MLAQLYIEETVQTCCFQSIIRKYNFTLLLYSLNANIKKEIDWMVNNDVEYFLARVKSAITLNSFKVIEITQQLLSSIFSTLFFPLTISVAIFNAHKLSSSTNLPFCCIKSIYLFWSIRQTKKILMVAKIKKLN